MHCLARGRREREGERGQTKAERQKYLARAVGSSKQEKGRGEPAKERKGEWSKAAELSCQLCEKLRFMRVGSA